MNSVMTVNRALMILCLFFLTVAAAKAQCTPGPARETAVRVRNESDYLITFYIDGESKAGVRANDNSVDFMVSPGEHILKAEALIDTETVVALRTAVIREGSVCIWRVTNPRKSASPDTVLLRDSLMRTAVIPLFIPN